MKPVHHHRPAASFSVRARCFVLDHKWKTQSTRLKVAVCKRCRLTSWPEPHDRALRIILAGVAVLALAMAIAGRISQAQSTSGAPPAIGYQSVAGWVGARIGDGTRTAHVTQYGIFGAVDVKIVEQDEATRRILEQILATDRLIVLELEALRTPGASRPLPGTDDVMTTGGIQP